MVRKSTQYWYFCLSVVEVILAIATREVESLFILSRDGWGIPVFVLPRNMQICWRWTSVSR